MDEDQIRDIIYAAKRIGDALAANVVGSHDETGGHVESLTEAVMGMTAGLCKIADAIDGLSSAIVDQVFSTDVDDISTAIREGHVE